MDSFIMWSVLVALPCAPVPSLTSNSVTCPADILIRPCSGPPHGSAFIQEKIQAGYNRNVRPHCTNGTHVGPTVVEVQFRLTHLSLVDVKQSRAAIQGYLRAWWYDPRLVFNSTSEGGCFDTIDLMEGEAGLIWLPDLYVDNLATGDDYTETTATKLAQISPDGKVWYSKQVLVTIDCRFNLVALPYDFHRCGLVLASYSQGVKQMRLMPKGGVLAYGESGIGLHGTDFSGAVWSPSTRFKDADFKLPGNITLVEGWDYATLWWEFKRNPSYYETAFILPSQLFLCLSYMQFYIDRAAAPARAALATMPVLIMVSLQQVLYSSLPEGAQRMWLADFIIAILILCVFSALEFGLVQVCQVMEYNREANLRGLQKVKHIANRLIKEAWDENITLLALLDRYEATEVFRTRDSLQEEDLHRQEGITSKSSAVRMTYSKTSSIPSSNIPSLSTDRSLASLQCPARSYTSLECPAAPVELPPPLPGQIVDPSQQDNACRHSEGLQSRLRKPSRSNSGAKCARLARSSDAEKNSIREADLIFIKYARQVFDQHDRADNDWDNKMHVKAFRTSLTHFNIYVSLAHAGHIMCMFLRDSGKTTGFAVYQESLRFSEYTSLLLQLDDYVLNPNGVIEKWWNLRATMQSMPPSACVDMVARCLFFILIFVLDLFFFCTAGANSLA